MAPIFRETFNGILTNRTFITFARYSNAEHTFDFSILAYLLEGNPIPEPSDRFYKVYPTYLSWVANRGLHDFAYAHSLSNDFLRCLVLKDIVRMYLDTLQALLYMTEESLNDLCE